VLVFWLLFLFVFVLFVFFVLCLSGFVFIIIDSEARQRGLNDLRLMMRSMLMQHHPVECKTKAEKCSKLWLCVCIFFFIIFPYYLNEPIEKTSRGCFVVRSRRGRLKVTFGEWAVLWWANAGRCMREYGFILNFKKTKVLLFLYVNVYCATEMHWRYNRGWGLLFWRRP
jgi:hypothetical protein